MVIFLKLKHWQLFGLFIGVPLTMRIINLTAFKIPSETVDFVLTILTLTYFWWSYSVGKNLISRIPNTIKMNYNLFKRLQVFIITSIALFAVTTYFLMTFSPNGKSNENIVAILGLLIGLTAFCIPYCIYFIAKTIRLAELQRPLSIRDYIADFLLILCFPVGVWIIQPRLNKLSEN